MPDSVADSVLAATQRSSASKKKNEAEASEFMIVKMKKTNIKK